MLLVFLVKKPSSLTRKRFFAFCSQMAAGLKKLFQVNDKADGAVLLLAKIVLHTLFFLAGKTVHL